MAVRKIVSSGSRRLSKTRLVKNMPLPSSMTANFGSECLGRRRGVLRSFVKRSSTSTRLSVSTTTPCQFRDSQTHLSHALSSRTIDSSYSSSTITASPITTSFTIIQRCKSRAKCSSRKWSATRRTSPTKVFTMTRTMSSTPSIDRAKLSPSTLMMLWTSNMRR